LGDLSGGWELAVLQKEDGWQGGWRNSPSRHFWLAGKHEQYGCRGVRLMEGVRMQVLERLFWFGMGDVIFWAGAAPASAPVLDVDSA